MHAPCYLWYLLCTVFDVWPGSTTLFPFDHVHPKSSTTSGAHVVVVYTTLGTAQAAQWHSAAVTAGTNGPVQYVLRHTVPKDAASALALPLQGFGVGLDIKNMEYKALDDRAPGVRNRSTCCRRRSTCCRRRSTCCRRRMSCTAVR